jgi:hypothetical protein
VRFPNWFKVAWWAVVTALVTAFLFLRFPQLVAGHAAPADVVVFLVWCALVLAPVFAEVELLGLRFKQEIEKAKQELRNEVRNSLHQQVIFSPAPTDAQLPEIKEAVRVAVAETFAAHGRQELRAVTPLVAVDPVAEEMFRVRHTLERELLGVAMARGLDISSRKPPTGTTLAMLLEDAGALEPRLARSLRALLGVASVAIHGGTLTANQASFVRESAPRILAALQLLAAEKAA